MFFAGLLPGSSHCVQGAAIFNIVESGNNVVASGSGTLNVAALSFSQTFTASQGIITPISAAVHVGAPANFSRYIAIPGTFTGPLNFGSSSGNRTATSGTGGRFGVNVFTLLNVYVPEGYNGGALSGTSTFANLSFATIGLTPGTYTYSWGSGGNADSITVNIGNVAAVPEPGTVWPVALSGFGLWAWAVRKRR